MAFEKATRKKVKLRAAFIGPSGSGKTITALQLANAIVDRYGGEIGVIDTQGGQIFDYAETKWAPHGFDVDSLDAKSSCEVVHASLANAKKAGKYSAIIVDSFSSTWIGEGGVLEQSEGFDNSQAFAKWKELNKPLTRLIGFIQRMPCHVLITMRTKTDWVNVKETKATKDGVREVNTPHRVGTAPMQKKGVEYEFSNFFRMDEFHVMTVERTSFSDWDRMQLTAPSATTFVPLLEWCDMGKAATPFVGVVGRVASNAQLEEFYKKCQSLWAWDKDTARRMFFSKNKVTPDSAEQDFFEEQLNLVRDEYYQKVDPSARPAPEVPKAEPVGE